MERFIKSPNLPEGKVSLALVDGRIDKALEESLIKRDIKLIKTEKVNGLYDAISFHPDLMLHHLGDENVVAAPNVDDKILWRLEEEGFKIIFGKKEIGGKYPGDIPYNTARFGDFAVCSIKHTDEILLDNLVKRNVKIIDTKQGYSKCSICVVDSSSVITSDKGLYKTLTGYGVDVLLITPGHIGLFELSHGFIGGASGSVSHNEIAFYGNLHRHPNGCEIKNFLLKHGKTLINLSENLLIDLGTLIPLKEYSILM